jgi:hypothetical protein
MIPSESIAPNSIAPNSIPVAPVFIVPTAFFIQLLAA